MLINLLSTYPTAKRDIKNRLTSKNSNKEIALRFGEEYFDGKRSQGYGGYKYDGRWVPIAKKIIGKYNLKPGNRVLDIGCAKGFLVKDLRDSCPGLEVFGLDISSYAIKNCHEDAIGYLQVGNAVELPFADNSFDLVLSINTLHNLTKSRCITALKEITRISKNKKSFIQVDSYSNEQEKENFINWMLTAKTYGTPAEWKKIFLTAGYDGDYYWTTI